MAEAKVFGIDVSKWQGNFNFAKAKEEGVKFVIIKAGGGDSGLYRDSKFETFYKKAREQGLYVGAYYFGAARTEQRALEEANSFLSYIQGKQFEMGVYYDVEGNMLNLGKTLLTNIIVIFCERVRQVYPNVGVYSNPSSFSTRMDDTRLKDYIHWVARWNTKKPSLASKIPVGIWQFGGETNYIRTNKVAGVVCDQDYCYFDINAATTISSNIPTRKTNEEIAQEVMAGLWGSGEYRKNRLVLAGFDYKAIQDIVNKLVIERDKAEANVDSTIDRIAREVIAGKWGNGAKRTQALTAAGYDAKKVQARVNELMKK